MSDPMMFTAGGQNPPLLEKCGIQVRVSASVGASSLGHCSGLRERARRGSPAVVESPKSGATGQRDRLGHLWPADAAIDGLEAGTGFCLPGWVILVHQI